MKKISFVNSLSGLQFFKRKQIEFCELASLVDLTVTSIVGLFCLFGWFFGRFFFFSIVTCGRNSGVTTIHAG